MYTLHSLTRWLVAQIHNVDDPSEDSIMQSVPVDCSTGVCSLSVSLASSLVEGVKYIVSVAAANRFGESQFTENSDPFYISSDNSNRGAILIFMST